jgi:SAM-dependent methyltransferase
MTHREHPFGTEYLDKLKGAGKLSRTIKKYLVYPKLGLEKTNRVLDFGCGDLTFLIYNTPLYTFEPTAYDINPEIEVISRDAQIPFYSDFSQINCSFDFIMCDNVLEHVGDWRDTFVDIGNCLDPAGTLVIGLPGLAGYATDETHKCFITEFDLTQIAALHGLVLKKKIYYPLNVAMFARIFQLYSRHILTYYIFTKENEK